MRKLAQMLGHCLLFGSFLICSGAPLHAQDLGLIAPGHVIGNGGTANPGEATDYSLAAVMGQGLCATSGAFPIYNATSALWVCSTVGGTGSLATLNGGPLTITPASGQRGIMSASSVNATGADPNFATGATRAFMDLSGTNVARFGSATGTGSAAPTQILSNNNIGITVDTAGNVSLNQSAAHAVVLGEGSSNLAYVAPPAGALPFVSNGTNVDPSFQRLNVSVADYLPSGTGAVAALAQNIKDREWVSSNDFGFVCDGTTDNTTAFQNAGNAAVARGGLLRIVGDATGTGTSVVCRVSSTVTFAAADATPHNQLQIWIDPNVVLDINCAGNGIVFDGSSHRMNYSGIRGGTIRCSSGSAGSATTANVKFLANDRAFVVDVRFFDDGGGTIRANKILLDNVFTALIWHNYFGKCLVCIQWQGSGSTVTNNVLVGGANEITDWTVVGVYSKAIAGNGQHNYNKVIGNYIEGGSGHGVSIEPTNEADDVIANNYFNTVSNGRMISDLAARTLIQGNSLTNATGTTTHAIYENGTGATISGNNGGTNTAATGSFVFVDSSSNGALVTGNNSNGQYGSTGFVCNSDSGTTTIWGTNLCNNVPAFGAVSAATNGQIFVGQSNQIPLWKTLSGDVSSVSAAGAVILGKVNGVSFPSSFTTNGVLYGNGTGTVQATAQGGANTILVANAGAPSFSATPSINTSLAVPVIGPLSDSTTALKFTKADLTTAILTLDTTNKRIGINKTPGAFDLDVNGAVNFASTLAVTGHVTLEGVTSTGATGSGNLVFASSPSLTGVPGLGVAGNIAVNSQFGSAAAATSGASDTGTTVAGSKANLVIVNSDTTTNNMSELLFAAKTGASSIYYAAGAIDVLFGARTNDQYPAGTMVFSISKAANAAPSEAMRIVTSGGLSIGNTTDAGAGGLDLNGQLYMPNITTTSAAQTGTVCWTSGGSPAGKFTADTTVGCLTSIAAAKNITGRVSPRDALRMVAALRPVSFRYKAEFGDGGQYEQFGLIAEEVASVDERMAGRDPAGTLSGVRYQELTAILAGAIQQLKADNDNLRAELAHIKRVISR